MSSKFSMRVAATAAVCAMAVGVLAGTASARILSTSSLTLRVAFSEVRITGAFSNITCQFTLEGSLHSRRSITKVVGGLVGYVTSANLGTCAEGQATVLRETLPWHLRYGSFVGALPNITSVSLNVVGFALRTREIFGTCLLTSTSLEPVSLTALRETASSTFTTARLANAIRTTCGEGVNAGVTSSAGAVTVPSSATLITVTLI
ncbi:MAG TPA: hypothetical protein VKB03_01895 [Conexibacter sp.]|nr:hypothetical protein [Conexibacter sp.]